MKFIGEKNMKKVIQSDAGTFSLIDSETESEFLQSRIESGRSIIFYPSEELNHKSYYYLISGKLFHANTEKFIHPGETIIPSNIPAVNLVNVIEDSLIIVYRENKLFDEHILKLGELDKLMQKINDKDSYTKLHCNRSGSLAAEIAIQMGVNEATMRTIVFASKIHDLGKIKLDKSILNKKGSLTFEEFEEVKKHSMIGYEIAKNEDLDERVCRTILEHHENLDGTGYPRGITDENISIEAKILSVADCLDALTSDRPYRRALSIYRAMDIIKKDIGVKFDKKVVEALCKVMEYKIEL